MTARSDKGHFVMLPLEPADAWFTLESPDRFLGAAMFTVFGNDEVLNVKMDDVPDVVCKRLGVDGRHRPTVRRALLRIIEAELLVADGAVTRLLYSKHAHRAWHGERAANGPPTDGEPTVNGPRTDSQRTANGRPSNGENGSSGGNDSGPAPHIEREKIERKKREKTRAGAREPLPASEGELEEGEPEPEFSTPSLVALAFKTRLIVATGNPPSQGHKVRDHYKAIAAWVDEKNGDAKRIITTLMDGFFRDKWVQSKSYPIGALASDPGKYFSARKNGFHRMSGGGSVNGAPVAAASSDLNLIGPPAPGEAE